MTSTNLQIPITQQGASLQVGGSTSPYQYAYLGVTQYAYLGDITENIYFTSDQAFQISAKGLKPSTIHFFNFNNANVSANCQPSGGVKGGSLVTDASGTVNFTFFYSGGMPSSATDTTAIQTFINNTAGNKTGVLSSADGSSISSITIPIIAGTSASGGYSNTILVPNLPTNWSYTVNTNIGTLSFQGAG